MINRIQTKSVLANSPMFQKLSDELLSQLAAISLTKHFHKGKLIFQEDSISKGFYIVTEGQVKIFKSSPEGKEQMFYALGPGDPFGITTIFNEKKLPASATSMTAASVLFFPKNKFIQLVTERPTLALSMLVGLSQRVCMLARKIGSLSLQEVPARLTDHLIYLAEKQGRTDKVILDMPKRHLASLLGTSPENLSRIFACLSRSGLIQVQGNTITLLNYKELIQQQHAE